MSYIHTLGDGDWIDTAVDWGTSAAGAAGAAVQSIANATDAAQQTAENASNIVAEKVGTAQQKLAAGQKKIAATWEKTSGGGVDVPNAAAMLTISTTTPSGQVVQQHVPVYAPVGTKVGTPGTVVVNGKVAYTNAAVAAAKKVAPQAMPPSVSTDKPGLPWWAWAGIFAVGGIVVVKVLVK